MEPRTMIDLETLADLLDAGWGLNEALHGATEEPTDAGECEQ